MLKIESNQAGYNPCFTYYYIVNEKGEVYHHKDKKWRKKKLKELTTFYFLEHKKALELAHSLIPFNQFWDVLTEQNEAYNA